MVTVVSYFKPEKTVFSLFILLVLGVLNIFSFAYFINLVLYFGVGVQLISLVLLVILLAKKFEVIARTFRDTFGQNKEDLEQSKISAKDQFKNRFEKLSDREIDNKLLQDLVPEAISALNEIKYERKNTDLGSPINSSAQVKSPQPPFQGESVKLKLKP